MPTQGPLFTSAGRNHFILSKQLCIILTVTIICAGFLFIRMEQSAVARSRRNQQHVSEHNAQLKAQNEALMKAKSQLEQDEDELTKMYEKWIADDTEDLKITREEIAEIQRKIDAVQAAQESHENTLAEKELILAGKEDVLSDLHAQLKEKNTLIKDMKRRVKKLGGTLPEKLKDMPDDDDWAW